MKTALLIVEAVTALVFVGMALPLLLGKVPPNGWYGVRVRKTLESDEIWYKANTYFGKDFLVASLLVLAICIALFVYRERMPTTRFLWIMTTACMVPYIVAVVKCLFYLRTL